MRKRAFCSLAPAGSCGAAPAPPSANGGRIFVIAFTRDVEQSLGRPLYAWIDAISIFLISARCFQRADVERPCIAHVAMHLVWLEPYVQLRRTKLADRCELSDRHVDGERRHPWGSRARDVCVCVCVRARAIIPVRSSRNVYAYGAHMARFLGRERLYVNH